MDIGDIDDIEQEGGKGGIPIKQRIRLPEHQVARINPVEVRQRLEAQAQARLHEVAQKKVSEQQRRAAEAATKSLKAKRASLERKASQVKAEGVKFQAAKAAPKRALSAPKRSVELVQKRGALIDKVKQLLKEAGIRKTKEVNKMLLDNVHKLADKLPIQQLPKVLNMAGRTKKISERVKGEIIAASQSMIGDISRMSSTNEGSARLGEGGKQKAISAREQSIQGTKALQDLFSKLTESIGTLSSGRDAIRGKLDGDIGTLSSLNASGLKAKTEAGSAFSNRESTGGDINNNVGLRDGSTPSAADRALVETGRKNIEAADKTAGINDGGRNTSATARDTARGESVKADTARTIAAGEAAGFGIQERGAISDMNSAQKALPDHPANDIEAASRDVEITGGKISEATNKNADAIRNEGSARADRSAAEGSAAVNSSRIPNAESTNASNGANKIKADAEHATASSEMSVQGGKLESQDGTVKSLEGARNRAASDMPSLERSPQHTGNLREKGNIDTNTLPGATARRGDADTNLGTLNRNEADIAAPRQKMDADITKLGDVEPVLKEKGGKLTEQQGKLTDELNIVKNNEKTADSSIGSLLSKKGSKLPDFVAVEAHLTTKRIVKEQLPETRPDTRPFSETVLSSAAGDQVVHIRAANEKVAGIKIREENIKSAKINEENMNNLNDQATHIKEDAGKIRSDLTNEGGKVEPAKGRASDAEGKAKENGDKLEPTNKSISDAEALRDGSAPTKEEIIKVKDGEDAIGATEQDATKHDGKRKGAGEDAEAARIAKERAAKDGEGAAKDADGFAKQEDAAKAENVPKPDKPNITGDEVDATAKAKSRAADEDGAARTKEEADAAKRQAEEENAAKNGEDIQTGKNKEDEAHNAAKDAEGQHKTAEQKMEELRKKLDETDAKIDELNAKRKEYEDALNDTDANTPEQIQRLKKLLDDTNDLLEAHQKIKQHMEENMQRLKDGLDILSDPDGLRKRIDDMEAALNEHVAIHNKLNNRKALLENLKGKGKALLDLLGIRNMSLRVLGTFLGNLLQCAINPTAYPQCNAHNQVFDSFGDPIPIEEIRGITIDDGYGHTFTVHPIIPPSTPRVPPAPWPPFSMSNVACVFGSRNYLKGCRDGTARGEADGSIDGGNDQVAQNDRILSYKPDEITDMVTVDTDITGQKLEAYCNQLMNAPQLSEKNIVAIFPECSSIFKRWRVQRGGATQSPEYNQGYMFGYNAAYIKAYDLAWIQSYAVTIHILPPPTPSREHGYGDNYGDGYGDNYGDGYGDNYGDGYGDGYGDKDGYGREITTTPYGEQLGGGRRVLHLHPKYKDLLEKIGKKTSCK